MSYSTMIDMAARCRKPHEAEHLFKEMREARLEPNIITYTSLIKAFGASGQADKALAAFEEMRPTLVDASTQGRQIAYQVIMAACAREGDYATTRRFFVEMGEEGVPVDRGHYHSLLAACARSCDAEIAEQVFAFMLEAGLTPDVQSYTALTSCVRNDLQRCKALREEMRQAGLEPNDSFFQEQLEAHVLAGDAAGARTIVVESRGGLERLKSRKVAGLLRQLQMM